MDIREKKIEGKLHVSIGGEPWRECTVESLTTLTDHYRERIKELESLSGNSEGSNAQPIAEIWGGKEPPFTNIDVEKESKIIVDSMISGVREDIEASGLVLGNSDKECICSLSDQVEDMTVIKENCEDCRTKSDSRAIGILTELCKLKRYKEEKGEDANYNVSKAFLWAEAFKLTDSIVEKKFNTVEGFEKYAKELPTDEWISVSDKLPENQNVVLIYRCDGVDILQYLNDEWYHYEEGVVDQRDVTHWMELPKKPKTVEVKYDKGSGTPVEVRGAVEIKRTYFSPCGKMKTTIEGVFEKPSDKYGLHPTFQEGLKDAETVEAKEEEKVVCSCNIGCSKQYLGKDYYCRNEPKN